MSRRPISKYWKAPTAVIVALLVAYTLFLLTESYVAAVGALLLAVFGFGAYALGNSSDLPGTAGRGDRNIRT